MKALTRGMCCVMAALAFAGCRSLEPDVTCRLPNGPAPSAPVTGCELAAVGPSNTEAQRLACARADWAARAPRHYTLTYQQSCFCAGAYVRAVDADVCDGTMLSIRASRVRPDGGGPLDRATAEHFSTRATVDHLFALIDWAVREDVARLTVEYDSTYGYPRELFIDPNQQIADDEFSVSAVVTP